MYGNDIGRIARLTAILTHLQTKRLLTASELAEKFSVSVRTIYRDIKILEQAGIPVTTEEGKGYTIMEHYRLPPAMFTESEANALITAEQLILKNKDESFVKAYSDAIVKIKAILKHRLKGNVSLLSERVRFIQNPRDLRTSDNLSALQSALTNYYLTVISYKNEVGIATERLIEPFALISTHENWLLLAMCRLRNEFRFFRLDRIQKLELQNETFSPHKMSLKEYFDKFH